jgi:hypothetical protein
MVSEGPNTSRSRFFINLAVLDTRATVAVAATPRVKSFAPAELVILIEVSSNNVLAALTFTWS